MAEDEEAQTLTARCHCGSVHFTVTVPRARLPLGVHLCHCSTCRYTHGALCVFHAQLPQGVRPQFVAPSSLAGSLTVYRHSRAKCERYFCSTCGCHVGDTGLDDGGEWVVATSVFADHGADVFQMHAHCLTASAPGGGLYEWLPRIGGREMAVWNPARDDPEWAHVYDSKPDDEGGGGLLVDAQGRERLRARCHCGGVSFTIPRPSIPEVSDDGRLRKLASPLDADKWVGVLDLCDDCRLVDGTHAVAWTSLPRRLLDPPMLADLAGYGTMRAYASSEGVRRGFCGTCGATVVWSHGDSDSVDVAVGLLRAPADVIAADWLTWRTGRIAHLDSGLRYDAAFAAALADGFARWGEARFGRVVDFQPST